MYTKKPIPFNRCEKSDEYLGTTFKKIVQEVLNDPLPIYQEYTNTKFITNCPGFPKILLEDDQIVARDVHNSLWKITKL